MHSYDIQIYTNPEDAEIGASTEWHLPASYVVYYMIEDLYALDFIGQLILKTDLYVH